MLIVLHIFIRQIIFLSKTYSNVGTLNVKNKQDHINAELDSNTLVFNSQPTSVACVSDMNALAGLCCAVD